MSTIKSHIQIDLFLVKKLFLFIKNSNKNPETLLKNVRKLKSKRVNIGLKEFEVAIRWLRVAYFSKYSSFIIHSTGRLSTEQVPSSYNNTRL